jgi:hypothetical protein
MVLAAIERGLIKNYHLRWRSIVAEMRLLIMTHMAFGFLPLPFLVLCLYMCILISICPRAQLTSRIRSFETCRRHFKVLVNAPILPMTSLCMTLLQAVLYLDGTSLTTSKSYVISVFDLSIWVFSSLLTPFLRHLISCWLPSKYIDNLLQEHVTVLNVLICLFLILSRSIGSNKVITLLDLPWMATFLLAYQVRQILLLVIRILKRICDLIDRVITRRMIYFSAIRTPIRDILLLIKLLLLLLLPREVIHF